MSNDERSLTDELGYYLQDFISYLKVERQLSVHTCDAYNRDISQFLCFLGHLDLLPKHVTLYTSQLNQMGLSVKSIMRKQSSLKAFCKYLFQEKRIDWKSTPLMTTPKQTQRLPSVLKVSQITQLINFATQMKSFPARNSAIFELFYSCGVRISECIMIKLSDFNTDRSIVKVSGKGKKQRLIPVGSLAIKAITTYINTERVDLLRADCDHTLFITKLGKPFSRQGMYQLMKQIIRQSGLPASVSPHTFRHSFATHLLQGDANLREVQELLGHEDIRTTQIYTKVSSNRLKKVYNKTHPKAS